MSIALRTLGDITRFHAAERGAKVALIHGDDTWTFADLERESNQVANALLAAGVRPQDRVAYLDKNSPQYFPFLFGAGKVNAVTVAVNWRLAVPEMEYILGNADARVLVVGDEFVDHVDAMSLPEGCQVVVLYSSGGEPPASGTEPGDQVAWDRWLADRGTDDPAIESAWTDTCYQLYTSGTTGLPKGVELTNRNFFSMLPAGSEEWGFDADSVNLVAMPLFHIAGSGWGVVGMFRGATTVLMRDVDPARILELIPRHGVTNALLVPAVLQFLLVTPGVQSTDFSSLRSMVYGASPITEEVLVASMRTMGCDFVQAYGLTETTGGITILRAADHDPGGPRSHLLRSAGQPWGDVELRIVDPATGEEVADGSVGEVWCRSVQNMLGYWADEAATEQAFPEGRGDDGRGWFRTGDAGYLEDGYLFLHDRVKDMIISGGENIYPAEVENALASHPAIADAAVIGVPSDRWGETVKAIITVGDAPAPSEADVIAHCRERIAAYKCPTSVDVVDAIPRNPSGKILKTKLRKAYWEGRDRSVN